MPLVYQLQILSNEITNPDNNGISKMFILSNLVELYTTGRSHNCVISFGAMDSKLIIIVFSIWIFCFTKGAPRQARHLGAMSKPFMPKMDLPYTYLFAVLSVSLNSMVKNSIKDDCLQATARGQKQTSGYHLSSGGSTCKMYTAAHKTVLAIGQGSSGNSESQPPTTTPNPIEKNSPASKISFIFTMEELNRRIAEREWIRGQIILYEHR